MITHIEDYFLKGCGRCARFETPDCATQLWSEVLPPLRALCLDAGLEETLKWGHPCYMHAGRNIAIIGAHRSGVRLSFFNAALMKDQDNLLQKQGPNTAHPDMVPLTSRADLDQLRPKLLGYLKEAMGYAEQGLKPKPSSHTLPLPDELTDALDADPALAEAFAALTPGRQKGYVLHIGSAKQSATRAARIEKLRDRIFAGKGYNER